MGVPVIPPNNAAIRSMVRLPNSGWDTSLPPSVLDLSRSSSLAAIVQVGPFPFITRNTLGASVNATATSNTSPKLFKTDSQTQSREERMDETTHLRSERPPVKKVLKGKAAAVPRKSNGRSSGYNGLTSPATKSLKTAKKFRQPSPEAPSIKRYKSHLASKNTPQGPSQVLSNVQVYMIAVNNTTSNTVVQQGGPGTSDTVVQHGGPGTSVVQHGGPGTTVVQHRGPGTTVVQHGGPGTSVVLQNAESGPQQSQQGLLKGLQREAQELRAVNNHLKQRLISYQNIFRDKQKLRKVINILCNNNQPPVHCA